MKRQKSNILTAIADRMHWWVATVVMTSPATVMTAQNTMAGTSGDNKTENRLTLHYDRPAEYFEEALVIGNGTMGAIVYGGTKTDRISLNDITLWTGEPDRDVTTPGAFKALPEIRELLDNEDYREAERANRKIQGHFSESYQPLGQLTIDYTDNTARDITAYRRSLDISEAVARTQYMKGGHMQTSEYFASAPDSVIVIRLQSSGKGIHATLRFTSQLPCSVTAKDGEITADGYASYHALPGYYKGVPADEHNLYDPERGTRFRTLVRAIARDADGKIKSYPSGDVKIEGCRDVTIIIANVTSFNGFDRNPATEGRDYRRLVKQRMARAARKTDDELMHTHLYDYQRFFGRVSLDIGRTDPAIAAMTTDKQLRLYTEEGQANPDLEALYFQYGRYLLISCSRTDGVPANLQGLWNEKLLPPWSCNYTSNINLEENYWAAETANLSEMHRPLLTFISNLKTTGETTAREYYGTGRGWCLGHNTDIWAMTCPVGLRVSDPSWACWNMGGAWVSTHIWEHYLFTMDKEFLARNYPLLKGAAEFCMDWLTEKDGHLLTSPGTSPENRYKTPDGFCGATSYGNTSDLAMTRECLLDAREAARTLGRDKNFIIEIDRTLKSLLPYHVGSNGNLQEWFHDWEDQDPQHRHQSHLFGLYPGHHLSPGATPGLARACARTLEIKGDNTTGWSTGWRVNLYARLLDSKNAYHIYRKLLSYVSPDGYKGKDARRGGGTYPNLLDAHSPFQIDGNFGGCAGVIEMLMQSTPSSITLLPALPEQWPDGNVNGICARGGFVVSMKWSKGRVTELTLTSRQGGKTTLKYNGIKKSVNMKAGETRRILHE
ncbi:glycoside hydrolase family 95 protein [Xylanibacter rodentium]|uniref:glycoside hydrolase family 95 protein n=1 Tax=Xylanibacter rodentium TaxID=2736289 RepID=UPI00258AF067|nr:glycoside hydrolase family 95 protein [Xylanibacter rodentium]